MDLRLTVTVPGQSPYDRELTQGTTYTLGRSETCDIVIASAYVSRTPIRVEWTGLGFDIVDTANRNPIVINGYPLSGRRQIRPNDVITIGDVNIDVQAVVDPNATVMMLDPDVTIAPGTPLMPTPAPPPPVAAEAPAAAPQPQAPAARAPGPQPPVLRAPGAQPPPPPPPPPPPVAAAQQPPPPAPVPGPPPVAPPPGRPAAPARPAGTDYGTLRVRSADGGINEYSIESRTVVVGRASGVNISIEEDISVDRRHFQLKIEEGQVTIEDLGSAGGTFLGSQRLQPNTVHRLAERQVIRFGNCEAELLPPGRSESGTKERPTTMSVSLAPPVQPITPGGTGTATITLQNRGRVVDQISLRIPDVDATWVEIRRPTVSLVPGARDEVTIVFKPPKTSAAAAGEHPFAVSAISAQSGSEVRALGRFTILQFEALAFSVRAKGKKGQFIMTVRNNGNAPAAHTFSATDEEEGLKYQFDAEHLELGPGEEKEVPLRVKPKRRNPFGQNKNYRFAVEARPEGAGTTRANAAAAYLYRAPFRRWRAMAFPLLSALGLGTVLIFARGNPATIIRWFDFGGSGGSRPAVTRTVEATAPSGGTSAPTTPATAVPTTPPPATNCAELAQGCAAVVINSPRASGNDPRSCLTVRSAPSRTSPEVTEKLCDGTSIQLISGPFEAEGYRWWGVELDGGTRGFVAERQIGGSGSPRDVGPWIQASP